MALLSIISHFNWTYFAVVSSCSTNELQSLSLFTAAARRERKCVAKAFTLPCVRSNKSYEDTLNGIVTDTKINVLVLLTTKDDTIGLLTAAKRINMQPGRLTLLAGTGWGNLALKRHGLESIAFGALTLNYGPQGDMAEFKRHFFSLNPQNNNYTAFLEFWEEVFNCSTGLLSNSAKNASCVGNEKLSEGQGWVPFTNVEPVFDAVFALFRAMAAQFPVCLLPADICNLNAMLKSSLIPKWLLQNSFLDVHGDRNVTFNALGCVEGRFDILHYAPNKTGNEYKVVGSWQPNGINPTHGKLRLSDRVIQWTATGQQKPPLSFCSLPCQANKGEVSVPDKNENIRLCCWKCKKCGSEEKVQNDTCVPCGEKRKPSMQRDTCEDMPEVTVTYTSTIGIVVLCFSSLGILVTTLVVLLFVKLHTSRIVKASGRESSFFMLAGICLCFIAPMIFFAKPSIVSCGAQKFIAGLSFSTVYAPLFLKTNRIFRIFQSAKSTIARPSLVSPISQILISLGIVGVQLLLGIVWVIGDPPRVDLKYSSNREYVNLFCKLDPYTMALNLFTCLVLMLACTWYAFKTRHFPKNYNETKSIMFTLYFSCFAWGVFMPTYLLSHDQSPFFRTYTLAVFCGLIAAVSLVGFFFPKVRLLLCVSQIDDKDDTVLTRVGANSKNLDTKKIVVDGPSREVPKTLQDAVSIATSDTHISDKHQVPVA